MNTNVVYIVIVSLYLSECHRKYVHLQPFEVIISWIIYTPRHTIHQSFKIDSKNRYVGVNVSNLLTKNLKFKLWMYMKDLLEVSNLSFYSYAILIEFCKPFKSRILCVQSNWLSKVITTPYPVLLQRKNQSA